MKYKNFFSFIFIFLIFNVFFSKLSSANKNFFVQYTLPDISILKESIRSLGGFDDFVDRVDLEKYQGMPFQDRKNNYLVSSWYKDYFNVISGVYKKSDTALIMDYLNLRQNDLISMLKNISAKKMHPIKLYERVP